MLSSEKDEHGKPIEIDSSELIRMPLQEKVILNFSQIFVGSISSVSINVKEVLIKEMVRPESHFDDFEEGIDLEYD